MKDEIETSDYITAGFVFVVLLVFLPVWLPLYLLGRFVAVPVMRKVLK